MMTNQGVARPPTVGSGIELPALNGRLPLGFLAALGTLRLVSEHVDSDVLLSWSPTTFNAHLHTTDAKDVAGIVTILEEIVADADGARVPGMPDDFPPPQAAPDELRTTPRALADRLAQWQQRSDPGLAADWVRALVTDLAADRNREDTVKITPLAAPSGKQSFGTMFAKTTDATRGQAHALHEALAGWHRIDNYTGEYLDHHVLRDAGDSLTGKSVERGVPGATWLALMAMPLLPVTGDVSGRRRGTGWQYLGHNEVMRWPIWRSPLDVHSARCLVDHPALTLDAHMDIGRARQRQLARLSVFAVATASRIRLPGRNFEGVLTPGWILPIANSA